jgi:hypothetical protein
MDPATGKPIPVCLAFRAQRPLHSAERPARGSHNGWFQDYGVDVQRGASPAAYVDGTFQIELPVGEVLVKVSKGFDYEPVRRKRCIEPHQRELSLEIFRFADLRSGNWASADTHVHFLSPSTAVLEVRPKA